eukprot:scaffold6887_cov161-Skeletonema_menzelii.AAC.2
MAVCGVWCVVCGVWMEDGGGTNRGEELNSYVGVHSKEEGEFYWTPLAIVQSITIFCLAGIAEIFGGYFVWSAVKGLRVESSSADDDSVSTNTPADESVDRASEKSYNIVKKPWWYALIGSFVLV